MSILDEPLDHALVAEGAPDLLPIQHVGVRDIDVLLLVPQEVQGHLHDGPVFQHVHRGEAVEVSQVFLISKGILQLVQFEGLDLIVVLLLVVLEPFVVRQVLRFFVVSLQGLLHNLLHWSLQQLQISGLILDILLHHLELLRLPIGLQEPHVLHHQAAGLLGDLSVQPQGVTTHHQLDLLRWNLHFRGRQGILLLLELQLHLLQFVLVSVIPCFFVVDLPKLCLPLLHLLVELFPGFVVFEGFLKSNLEGVAVEVGFVEERDAQIRPQSWIPQVCYSFFPYDVRNVDVPLVLLLLAFLLGIPGFFLFWLEERPGQTLSTDALSNGKQSLALRGSDVFDPLWLL